MPTLKSSTLYEGRLSFVTHCQRCTSAAKVVRFAMLAVKSMAVAIFSLHVTLTAAIGTSESKLVLHCCIIWLKLLPVLSWLVWISSFVYSPPDKLASWYHNIPRIPWTMCCWFLPFCPRELSIHHHWSCCSACTICPWALAQSWHSACPWR